MTKAEMEQVLRLVVLTKQVAEAVYLEPPMYWVFNWENLAREAWDVERMLRQYATTDPSAAEACATPGDSANRF